PEEGQQGPKTLTTPAISCQNRGRGASWPRKGSDGSFRGRYGRVGNEETANSRPRWFTPAAEITPSMSKRDCGHCSSSAGWEAGNVAAGEPSQRERAPVGISRRAARSVLLLDLLPQRGDVGPEFQPRGTFLFGQRGQGLLVAQKGQVRVLLPMSKALQDG